MFRTEFRQRVPAVNPSALAVDNNDEMRKREGSHVESFLEQPTRVEYERSADLKKLEFLKK